MKQNDSVLYIYDTGIVSHFNSGSAYRSVFPVVYLNSNIKVKNDNDGSSISPFTLNLK